MNCINCGKNIPVDSLFCPYCDAPQNGVAALARDKAWAKAGGSKRFLYGLMIAELVLIVILTITLANRPAYPVASFSSTPVASLSSSATSTSVVSASTSISGSVSIKKLVAKQQDATNFSVYFVLADQQGNITRGEGSAVVDVIDPSGARAFRTTHTVKPENFVTIQTDSGDSDLAYSFGLFNYADMGRVSPSGKTYKIHLTFTPTGGTPISMATNITLQ